MMLEGKHVALVSDAGTPGISDPGYLLINLAVQEKIPVVPIPGAVAAIAALSISGLPTDRFLFEGFLPSRRAARGKRLAELHNEQRTLVLYEAPHRIVRTVDDLVIALGDRKAVVVRELTKVHEEIIRGTLSEIRDRLATGTTKGEFTIVVRGAEVHPGQAEVEPLEHLRNLILSQGLSKKDAIALAAKDLGLPKKEVYKESLKL
jgi:16S rRNA (cytidine1402-2'-O)-methyltransferase